MFVWSRRADRKGLEKRFPHHNWPVVLGLLVILNTAYAIFTPSIYQFITTPESEEEQAICENNDDSEKFWPGLASSETVYAWVLMAYSIPETSSMPFAGIMAEKMPYTVMLLITCALYATGGVFYGQAAGVWMVMVGRAFMGIGAAFADVTVSSYIGEMGTRMDEIRHSRGKKPRKYTLYVAYSFTMNCTFMLTFGVTSIMAQFKSIEPYHWPGWFITTLAGVYALIVTLTFTEPRPFRHLRKALGCQCLTGVKMSLELKSGWKIRLISYIFLISCGYMVGQVYAILTTLVTPVLSDQFGFSVEYTSHYLVGVSAAFIAASVIQLVTKILKLNNCILLGLAFLGALVGTTLMGDWQAIGCDPCSLGGNDILEGNCTVVDNVTYDLIDSGSGSGDMPLCSNASHYANSVRQYRCEARNGSEHECFWNPVSRITGEFCNTCHESCQSKRKSMDFYQFGIGVLIISLASPLGFIYVAAITSDITSVESQGTMLSLVIGSGAFARAISPLWFVESYALSSNHTYISMAITALSLALILVSLLALYQRLAPKPILSEAVVTRHASVNFLASLDTLHQPSPGPY